MKKIWIFLIIVVLFLTWIIAPIRTIDTMKTIAQDELVEEILYQFGEKDYEAVLKQLKGPKVIENNQENCVEFLWYAKVTSNDTTRIRIAVFRSPFSKYFLSPRVTMNSEWQLINPY